MRNSQLKKALHFLWSTYSSISVYSKFLLLFSLFHFSYTNLFCQNNITTPAGARGIGTGNANITYTDIHSAFNNQAGLAYLEKFSANTFIENRFLLKELNLVAIAIAHPTKLGTWGMILQQFGFKDFQEQKIGFNYSRQLFKKMAIGAQFDFLNTRIASFGSDQILTFEIGLHFNLTPKIIAGVHVYNPIRSKIGRNSLPSIFQVGMTYQVSESLNLSGSIEKDVLLPFNLRLGLEYCFQEKIQFQAGVNSNPNRYSIGVGYHLKSIQINVAASFHTVLGTSPAFGLTYKIK